MIPNSNTTLKGGEIGIENPEEIATLPKYYERRRKGKLPVLEIEEGQGPQIEIIERNQNRECRFPRRNQTNTFGLL